ncbi:MAG: cupin domain-containing protein [Candidatus Binataceae bacterium]
MSKRRPPFIIASNDVPEHRHRYPNTDEFNGYARAIGYAAGLLKMGVNLMRLPPGERSSWPHAEEKEEEFVYVLQGDVDAWVDGVLHPMGPGDFAAFPSGTGISHCFINNGAGEVLLLVGGEASRRDNRIYYPLHPQRRNDMPWSGWWDDVPARRMGAHDGMTDAIRTKAGAKRRKRRAAS